MNYSKELKLATMAVKSAGAILTKRFKMKHKISFKTEREEVTEADKLAEKKILSILRKSEHGILSEEAGRIRSSAVEWVVDPLDGTTNYSIGIPFFNSAVALVVDGKPVVGAVYSPITNELFTAMEGKGAYLNGRRIHVKDQSKLEKSIVTFCHSSTPEGMTRNIKVYKRLKEKFRVFYQPRSGNLEMALIAAGRIHGFISNNAKPWDSACGTIMVREARGLVTDFKGKQWNMQSKDLLTAGKSLHFKLLKTINGI